MSQKNKKEKKVKYKTEMSERKKRDKTKAKKKNKNNQTKKNERGKVGSRSRRDVYLKPEQLLVYTNRILRRNLFKCVFKRQVLLL